MLSRQARLDVLRMVLPYPVLYQGTKLCGPLNQFFRLCVGSQAGVIVVYLVAFTTAGIEIVDQCLMCRAENEAGCLERDGMMTGLGRCNAIACAGEDHLCELLHGIVRYGEPTVGRQLFDRRVLEIAVDDRSQLVKLAAACLVSVQSL